MAGQIEVGVFKGPGIYILGQGLPFTPPFVLPDASETIVHISSCCEHSALVFASGRVYTLGRTSDHAWMKKDKFNKPTRVPGLESVKIVQAACGENFTFFLSDKGELYSCGVNDYGQLGQGTTENNPTPTLVKDLPRIKKVCAGQRHTVVLTHGGEVYVCGSNNRGQLGLQTLDIHTSFVDIHIHTQDIACGYFHTALLLHAKYLLMSGWNEHRQVTSQKVSSISSFYSASLCLVTPITAAACGRMHTVALLSDNTVWAWGNNACGQLGNGVMGREFTPTRVMGLEGHLVKKVFAGDDATAYITDKGRVFVCGKCFGANRSVPHMLKMAGNLEVVQVAFGSTYSAILVNRATQVVLPAKKKRRNEVSLVASVTDSKRLAII